MNGRVREEASGAESRARGRLICGVKKAGVGSEGSQQGQGLPQLHSHAGSLAQPQSFPREGQTSSGRRDMEINSVNSRRGPAVSEFHTAEETEGTPGLSGAEETQLPPEMHWPGPRPCLLTRCYHSLRRLTHVCLTPASSFKSSQWPGALRN